MNRRIDYSLLRSIMFITLPYIIICTIPNWLGITTVKPEYQNFRAILDSSIFGLFIGCVGCTIYALVHNAKIGMKYTKEKTNGN